MARSEIQKLYQELMNNKFNFINEGEIDLYDLYKLVKVKYPDCCDDNYLCSMNCSQGPDQPEWKHTVRKVLDRLKNIAPSHVEKGNGRGKWIIKYRPRKSTPKSTHFFGHLEIYTGDSPTSINSHLPVGV